MSQIYTIKKIENEKDYTLFQIKENPPLTQDFWYGVLQEKMGRKVLRVSISKDSVVIGFAQVIVYPFFKNTKYAYLPYGPVVKNPDESLHLELASFIQNFFKDENLVCVRQEVKKELASHFHKTPNIFVRGGYVQPRYEWEIALLENDESLFSSYHKQTRKNIRNAERAGVTVKIFYENMEEKFGILENILKETAGRKGFSLYKIEYYKEMIKILDKEKKGFLAFAYGEDGTVLSGSLHVIVGKTAHGVFGGSISARRDEYGPFILKYYAMKYARTRGCTSFSIGGIIPPGREKKYKSWQGFTHFKQSFGGSYLVHDVLVDKVYRNRSYLLVSLFKWIRGHFRLLICYF